ncbi:cytochrome P450 [Dactylonectria macrodidyma]|uniref:Cytochrome P450 n=1 Tax=Dactylonectria macrodidyma TaxID=307937 RepID=A0A9P9EB34_9HYPO|nr:cytochrome P450 [Dactylonectria macrodidyma]
MLTTHRLFWLALVAGFIRLLFIGRRPKNYPPGPPTLPILGNIHLMPTRDAHLQFQKWAQEYGPVYSLILGTKTLIVLSSDQAVKDLLDRKSALYSHRQEMYVGQALASGGLRLLMMVRRSCNSDGKQFRKLVHSLLNVTTSKGYVPYQDLENKQMLYEMLVQPDQFLENIRRYSNALTTTMVFGWRTPIYRDKKLTQLFDGFAEFADLNQTGAAALLDSFPLLRSLPDFLVPMQKKAKKLHQKEKALYLSHWLKAKSDIANGTIKPCFCEGLAEAQKKDGFDDAQAAYLSGTLLEAGSDTTSNTLYAFVQAMLLYPEVQRKAQGEVDKVVGSSRMPTMEDESSLQTVRACMKETLRWMPTTILGAVPHAVTEDDTYNGYIIPKGAGVLNNVWAIHMDPKRHHNPRQFNPERYCDDQQSLADAAANRNASQRDQFTFGAGRRICPGIHVAERSLFLGMSRLLWAFTIEPALNVDGRPILPDPDKLTQGFVCMPEEFPARFVPRSKEREAMIIQEWREAEKECLDPETKQWR